MSERTDYSLLDSGNGRKLERFGPYILVRPCAQAVWAPSLSEDEWRQADASFSREEKEGWEFRTKLPSQWTITVGGVVFKISPTDFGHLGIFPEQRRAWEWLREEIAMAKKKTQRPVRVLNLFAYSGGATLAAALGGAEVCHLDASKGMVAWARENAHLSALEKAPIRWIVDDVMKFLQREERRGSRYEGVILDPPTFGRGSRGEVFKIDEEIQPLLRACRAVLSEQPRFVLFSCHTPGYTPITMHHLLAQMMKGVSGQIEAEEMVLEGETPVMSLPSGCYGKWVVQE
jgi:23S rRNA (cytosine1962-C5)-methyltransferase